MEEVKFWIWGIFTLTVFKLSCCDLIEQLVEKLQSHQEIELVSDLAETDENLTVSCKATIVCIVIFTDAI